MKPYYADDTVTLYHGDMREILPLLRFPGEYVAIVTDPPYGETSLEWDRWPTGWPYLAREAADSMWCFGSMRMLLEHYHEFSGARWRFSQDVVWEKHNGSGFHADRFKRVHEHATHWYQGAWNDIHHEVPTTPDATARAVRRKQKPAHLHDTDQSHYVSEDGGPRLMRSVIQARSMHGRAIHSTEKPVRILAPLIEYACPPGEIVLDPFAGSCSSGVAARLTGRRAVLIEADEAMCEKAVRERLLQDVLPLAAVAGSGEPDKRGTP